MVRFDQMRLAGLGTGRLNHIRINRSLRQPFGLATELAGFFLKHINKHVTDDLTLLFRVIDTVQCREKTLFSIDPDNAYTHVLGKSGHHLVTFLVTQQAVINKHAHQLITDSLVQQRCNH